MTPGLPQPDFLRPVARPGWLAWAWCGTGLLVLAASVADGHAAWQQRSQALARLDSKAPARAPAVGGQGLGQGVVQGAAPGVAGAAARLPASAQARPSDALARQAEAMRWLQQLALPWPAVWAASEAVPAGVQWLLLEHGTNGLRLSGLAADLAPAQASADALRTQQHQGKPVWQGVLLASVERVPEGQRFELSARLSPMVVPMVVPMASPAPRPAVGRP